MFTGVGDVPSPIFFSVSVVQRPLFMTLSVLSRLRHYARRNAFHLIAALSLVLLLAAMMARPAAAQFRDVGYTFEPTVQGVFEENGAAFQNGRLYGGALGLSFGRYFQASAEYLINTGLTTDFSNIDRLDGLIDQDLDVRRYGARLRFNLYDRQIIPYLTAGSGVLRFDPEGGEASRTIYGTFGGGITFSAYDRYQISIGGELLNYRYDPVATFLGPSGAEDFETGTRLVSSPALSASVALFLGGRSLEERTAVDRALQEQFGGRGFLRGVRLFVNPFHGRIEFNDALGFPKDQNVAGINAGVSLGPYVGLRGFYWRGTEGSAVTEDIAGGFDNIQMYGGELNLRLNLALGQGFVPYAKVGGGYLDVMGQYDEDIPENESPPADRFFGTSGVGLEVPLTRSIKLSGGARALFMDNPNVVEEGDPGDIYGSLMYTAGIEFRLGGGAERPTPQPQPVPGVETAEATDEEQAGADEQMERTKPPKAIEEQTEAERLQARADSLEAALAALQSEAARRAVPARVDTSARRTPGARRSNFSGRTMRVPVPEEGEIYIRFGDGAATPQAQPSAQATEQTQAGNVPDDLEQRVREALRQQLQQQSQADTAQALTDADIERLIQRTVRNVMRQRETTTAQRGQNAQAQQIQRLQNQISELQRQLRQQQRNAAEEPEPVSEISDVDAPFYRSTLGRPLTYLVPITGFRAGEGENQFQIGVRGDYRSTPTSQLHFVPELSFGLGGGQVSPTVLFSGAYSFLRDTTTELVGVRLEPYVGAGVGIASLGGFTFEPVLNTMIGVDYRLGADRRLFLEYSTFDLFETHRVHVGVRVRL